MNPHHLMNQFGSTGGEAFPNNGPLGADVASLGQGGVGCPSVLSAQGH